MSDDHPASPDAAPVEPPPASPAPGAVELAQQLDEARRVLTQFHHETRARLAAQDARYAALAQRLQALAQRLHVLETQQDPRATARRGTALPRTMPSATWRRHRRHRSVAATFAA